LNFGGRCIRGTRGRNRWDRRVHIGNRGLKGTARKDENIMNSVEDIWGAFYTDYRTFKKRCVEHAGTAVEYNESRCVEHAGTAVVYNSQWNPSHRRNIEGEKDVDVRSVRNFPATSWA
jgi:hypothetical protein